MNRIRIARELRRIANALVADSASLSKVMGLADDEDSDLEDEGNIDAMAKLSRSDYQKMSKEQRENLEGMLNAFVTGDGLLHFTWGDDWDDTVKKMRKIYKEIGRNPSELEKQIRDLMDAPNAQIPEDWKP